jgi:hypothetical protein
MYEHAWLVVKSDARYGFLEVMADSSVVWFVVAATR